MNKTAHHFADATQQYETSVLGMWVFILTEILFFGGLFLSYMVYRGNYPDGFAAASGYLDVIWGTLNTAVLITSSLTMAFAVFSAKAGKRNAVTGGLVATIILGIIFLGIKFIEYEHKFHEHLVPGKHFEFPGLNTPGPELFFSLYFAMTGLHALHMVIGIGILATFAVYSHQGRFNSSYFTPIEISGLYWHFVDIVWIFLFPLLYLIGRHG